MGLKRLFRLKPRGYRITSPSAEADGKLYGETEEISNCPMFNEDEDYYKSWFNRRNKRIYRLLQLTERIVE